MTRGAADGSSAMSGRARPWASACLAAVLLLLVAAACSGAPGGPDAAPSPQREVLKLEVPQREVEVLEREVHERRVLVVSGVREQAADGEVQAWLYPLFAYETSEAVSAPEGSGYTLELLDGQGGVLRSVGFAAHTLADSAGDVASESWVVFVADPPDYRGVRVWRGSEKVAEVEASGSAPEVKVTAPAAGQTHTGETVHMSWSASDADGDSLSYRVYYSTDAGVSWRLLSAGQTESMLVWPRADLVGSDNARIRVIATDGVLSAAAESAVFSLAQSPPRVYVHSPRQGQIYGGHAIVFLEADAYDTEDGGLDSSKIAWRSSIDGPIATSGFELISTDDLSTGVHTITATATDSDNMTGSASVTVSVRAINDAPVAVDDLLHAVAGRDVDLAVLANDVDTEGDIFTHTLRVVVPAKLGETGRGSRSGTVGYRSDTAGYDVFEYEICDQQRQCDTAQTVVVVEAGR